MKSKITLLKIIQGLFTLLLLGCTLAICNETNAAESICAVVKIEIRQEMTLERQAFDAHMRINNGFSHITLEDVDIDVSFADEDGNSILASSDPNNTDALFFIRLDSMENINAVDGSGAVQPTSTADIHWLIIPAPGASNGLEQGTLYYVGATLTYTIGGEEYVMEVIPDYIFVKPMPEITLDYFLPMDVYGDDAFTPEIEPSIPFSLGVLVRNNGYGVARNLKIDSAQPKIIENEQGLLIGFVIEGCKVNGQTASPSLLADFGDIAPNDSAVARWGMTCSFSGEFVEFNADFSHSDELGGELTSLLEAANTHFLIHDVLVDLPDRDHIRDFLAKDGGIYRIFESDSVDTEVLNQSASSSLQFKGNYGSEVHYTFSTPVTSGFMYVQLPDPQGSQKVLKEMIRSDGKRIKPQNTWLSKSRNDDHTWQHFVNLFDVNTTNSYTLIFDDAAIMPQAPVLQFIPDRSKVEGQQLSFIVEASDPNATIPTLSASPLPAGTSFIDQEDGTGIFDWTPAMGQAGRYDITFRASDGILEDSQRAKITIYFAEDADGDGMPDEWEIEHFGTLDRDGTGDFDRDGISDLDEYRNGTDPAEEIPLVIEEVIPHHGAGIDDDARIPENTCFAVLVDAPYGVDLTSPESIRFTVNDGDNEAYERDLMDNPIVSVTKLTDDDDTETTKLWAVYHRSADTWGNYTFGSSISISVEVTDSGGVRSVQETYSFKVQTSAQRDEAQAGSPVFEPVSSSDPALDLPQGYDTGIEVTEGILKGAKIIFNSTEPTQPAFGPWNELTIFDEPNANAVGRPLNIVPSTVFTIPAKVFIPCPDHTDVSDLSVYLHNGLEWVLACDAEGNVKDVAGWMVPGSLIKHNGDPSFIEIRVYHCSGIQAGKYAEAENQTPGITSSVPATGTEDIPYSYNPTVVDADGDTLTWSLNNAPEGMTIDEVTGLISWTPTEGVLGSGEVTLSVDDGNGGTDTEVFTITVTPVNDAPIATNDSATTDEDFPVSVNVLTNDSDVEDDILSVQAVTQGSNGAVTIDGTTVIYTPNADFNGADSFTYTVSDGNGGTGTATATVSITINPVNDAPVVDNQAVTTDEDVSVTVNCTGSDVDEDSLTFSVVEGPDHGTLVGTAPYLTYSPDPNYNGSDSFTFKTNDGALDSNTATVSITINPVNDTPVIVSYDPVSQTVQYSDGITPVTIAASDIDSSALTISAPDLPEGLTIDSEECSTDISGVLTCTWTLSGQALVGAGEHNIMVIVNDGELQSTTHDVTLLVEPEDAAILFDDDNPVAERVVEAGGNSGMFYLTVYVSELDEPLDFPGDIDLADFEMTLVPVGPGTPVVPISLVRNDEQTGYDAVLSVTYGFSEVPVNTYTVEATVNGDYYDGYKEDVFVIYDPSLGFATGGGWFYWPGTEDTESGYPGDRTNFGFNMKYDKKGENVKGSLLLISHLPDGSIYRVKSNALYGLALGESEEDGEYFGWASFSGKCTYLEPGWVEPEGNYEFLVYIEDRNELGVGVDQLWIQILDKDRVTVDDMSMPSPAHENTSELQGGNVVVPHGGW